MTSEVFEAFLARIYTNEQARARFLEDPKGEALAAGLMDSEAQALEHIDQVGLLLFADSFQAKRRRGRRVRLFKKVTGKRIVETSQT